MTDEAPNPLTRNFVVGGEPPAGERPPPALPRYEVRATLGSGGMGVVYLAHDRQRGVDVALKVLRATQGEQVIRFQLEGAIGQKLQHPHIIGVRDLGQAPDGSWYMALDYIQGLSLAVYTFRRGGRLDPAEAARLLAVVARALHHAHQAGVLHRDLKPENIIVDGAGTPFLLDFGLAKDVAADRGLTTEGQLLGTPVYMSPEQVRGEFNKLDARSDVYSLGATLYFALTGRPPFEGDELPLIIDISTKEPPPPSVVADVPVRLSLIVERCLAKEPAARFATAEALAEALETWSSGPAPEPAPPAREPITRRITERLSLIPPRILQLLGLLVLGLVAGVVWLVLRWT